MKEYYADVNVKWGTSFGAKDKKDFIEKIQ